MKLYRIFTENKRKKWLCQLISEHFDGFTIFETIGYWQGKSEKSLCFEIMTDSPAAKSDINRICRAINGYNKQDCVLVQTLEVESQSIGISGLL